MTSFHTQSPIPCLLSNEAWVTGSTYDVLDPHDAAGKKVMHTVSCATKADAIKAVEVAAEAFKTWKNSAIAQRQQIFRKAAALLQERSAEYADIEMLAHVTVCKSATYSGAERKLHQQRALQTLKWAWLSMA